MIKKLALGTRCPLAQATTGACISWRLAVAAWRLIAHLVDSYMNWKSNMVGRSGNPSTDAGKVQVLPTNPCLRCHASLSDSREMPSAQLDFDSTHSKYIQICIANNAAWMLPASLSRSALLLLPRTNAIRAAVLSINQTPRFPRSSSGNFNIAIRTMTSSNWAMYVTHGYHML